MTLWILNFGATLTGAGLGFGLTTGFGVGLTTGLATGRGVGRGAEITGGLGLGVTSGAGLGSGLATILGFLDELLLQGFFFGGLSAQASM